MGNLEKSRVKHLMRVEMRGSFSIVTVEEAVRSKKQT